MQLIMCTAYEVDGVEYAVCGVTSRDQPIYRFTDIFPHI